MQSDRRVEVSLNDDEFSALIRLCQADMRNAGFELRYLLIREFDRRGMIDERGRVIIKEVPMAELKKI